MLVPLLVKDGIMTDRLTLTFLVHILTGFKNLSNNLGRIEFVVRLAFIDSISKVASVRQIYDNIYEPTRLLVIVYSHNIIVLYSS